MATGCDLTNLQMGGISLGLFFPLYFYSVPVIISPLVPMTASSISKAIQHGNVSAASLTPLVLEEMCRHQDMFNVLCGLHTIQVGSGPLTKSTGDLLSQRVDGFQSVYASTELSFPLFPTDLTRRVGLLGFPPHQRLPVRAS